ncbi:hypothetical protein SDC9_88973 [bioreactor metagenome]|uniref:Uncharacterized protein n=1 Tax=bioreactor metagenome TaxID=1076179 RepID=A0A644ZPJ3_9ZZZZ
MGAELAQGDRDGRGDDLALPRRAAGPVRTVLDVQRVAVPVQLVGRDVGRPHLELPAVRGPGTDGEPGDVTAGAGGHRGDPRVVPVEDRPAVLVERLDEFTLGLRGHVLGAELAEVGVPDVEDDGDGGRGDRAQVGDVAEAPGTHLGDEEAGGVVAPGRGERGTDLVVERAERGDRRAGGPQHLGDQILGGGLAGGAGDADHRQVGAGVDDVAGQRGEGALRVVDDQTGHPGILDRPEGDGGDRAGERGPGDVVVAVDLLAGEGDEERPGGRLPGVDDHVRTDEDPLDGARCRPVGWHDPGTDRGGDLGQGAGLHVSPPRSARRYGWPRHRRTG